MRPWKPLLAVLLFGTAPAALACDTCGLYCPADEPETSSERVLSFGMSEQFTHMGRVQLRNVEVLNPDGEYLDASLTQFFVGYDLTPRLALQLNVPLLVRSFRRLESGEPVQRSTSGLGDLLLFASFTALRHEVRGMTLQLKLQGGLKMPTGGTGYLEEEGRSGHGKPARSPSAIHGRDITLGSGSFDAILGTDLGIAWRRLMLSANVQYALRGTGTLEYRFGNDLNWRGGPAVRLGGGDLGLKLHALLSGEHKAVDSQYGVDFLDTGRDSVYLGPLLSAAWQRKLGLELGFAIPLKLDHGDLTAVPDWRLRLGVNWQLR